MTRKIFASITRIRGELNELEAVLRVIGENKAQARVLADLRDRTNDLANEIGAGEKQEAK
jgi:hypothetical protein